MSGRIRRAALALGCLAVIAGCSGSSDAPPAGTTGGDASQGAVSQPEVPLGEVPGSEVDADELLGVVQAAVDGVTTMTASVTVTSQYKGEDQSMYMTYVFDGTDRDRPLAVQTNRFQDLVTEYRSDGEHLYMRVGDGRFREMSESSGETVTSVILTPQESFIRVEPFTDVVSKAVFVGEEKVGDFPARHYQLTVDPAVLSLDSDNGETTVFDMWLNGDNLPVKTLYSGKIAEKNIDVFVFEGVVESYGPVDIRMPEASEIEG